jgi:hypothetical protein
MISEEREKAQSNSSEYVTYHEAAGILNTDYTMIAKAAAIGVFRTVRPMKAHHKVIPRWEVEALIGWTITNRQALDRLDGLRRQRAKEEYAVDGTVDWVPKSEIDSALEDIAKAQKMILAHQERLMEAQKELDEHVKKVADHLLSLDPDTMMREIFADYLQRTGK